MKSKRSNCNDGSFQALGAIDNLSIDKSCKCMHDPELGVRRKTSSGESFDWIWGTNEQTNLRINLQTNQLSIDWLVAMRNGDQQNEFNEEISTSWAMPGYNIRTIDIQQTRKGCRASLSPYAQAHSISYDNQCFLPWWKVFCHIQVGCNINDKQVLKRFIQVFFGSISTIWFGLGIHSKVNCCIKIWTKHQNATHLLVDWCVCTQ